MAFDFMKTIVSGITETFRSSISKLEREKANADDVYTKDQLYTKDQVDAKSKTPITGDRTITKQVVFTWDGNTDGLQSFTHSGRTYYRVNFWSVEYENSAPGTCVRSDGGTGAGTFTGTNCWSINNQVIVVTATGVCSLRNTSNQIEEFTAPIYGLYFWGDPDQYVIAAYLYEQEHETIQTFEHDGNALYIDPHGFLGTIPTNGSYYDLRTRSPIITVRKINDRYLVDEPGSTIDMYIRSFGQDVTLRLVDTANVDNMSDYKFVTYVDDDPGYRIYFAQIVPSDDASALTVNTLRLNQGQSASFSTHTIATMSDVEALIGGIENGTY